MPGYHGDIRLGDTIDVKFNTFDTDGAPITLAGTPAVAAYVGNGTTEITAGITLTVDFDSRTGCHNVRVVASGGNGFAAGTNVSLVITQGTVDGVSVVGAEIGSFSIENRSAFSVVGNGTYGNSALKSLIDTVDDFLDTEIAAILAAVDTEVATIVTQTAASAIRSAVGLASANLDTQLSAIDDFLDTEVAAILAAVDTEIATIVSATTASAIRAAVGLSSANLDTQLAAIDDYIDTEVAAILAAVDTEVATIVSQTAASAIRSAVGLASANLDTQLSAIDDLVDTEVAAILAAVDTEIAAIISTLGSAGAGLTNVPWNASWDAEVQSEVDDALKAGLTEGYRSTGGTGSVRDLLYELIAHMGNSGISGTLKTLTKLDKSTTAKTFTLDDDTTPTAIEETT